MKFYNKGFKQYLPNSLEYPLFALVKDGWNDYGHHILYNLIFFKSQNEAEEIGHIKILDRRTEYTQIPNSFSQLDENYCSLGQSLEFYKKIKELFPETYLEIFSSLNDIAFNSQIDEAFKREEGYNGALMRFGSAEKAYKEAKLLLIENTKLVNENLLFNYSVLVSGANSKHEVHFDFIKNDNLPYRINVIIGKNGTGKTQFLGSMVNSISGVKYQNSFFPYNPLFRKVIAISYSLFDDFPKPEETTVFSYKYIGIRSKNEEIVSDEKLGEKLRKALMTILKEDRSNLWFDWVSKIIQLENLGLNNYMDLTKTWVENLSYKNAKRLSSGQSITLFILTELIASILEESLILFDEPETHLHPSAIGQLIIIFHEILSYFNSYAIISTHSPIIIQDIPSKYITIFDRTGDSPIIRQLPLESFGENISSLTSKVFDTLEVKELYKIFLEKLSYQSIEDVESLFENKLSINAQLYLAALQKNRSK
jgi:ABC-type cobalamin/Fe3+-siderophores transport system ATPase subunit